MDPVARRTKSTEERCRCATSNDAADRPASRAVNPRPVDPARDGASPDPCTTAHPARVVARSHQPGARKLAVHPHAVDDLRDPDEEADQEGQAEEHDDDLEQASTFHEAMMPQALRPSLSGQTSASGTEPARPPVSTANAPDTAWGRRPAPEQVRHVLAAPLRWLPAAGNAGSSSAAPPDLRSGAGGSRRDSSCQSDPD